MYSPGVPKGMVILLTYHLKDGKVLAFAGLLSRVQYRAVRGNLLVRIHLQQRQLKIITLDISTRKFFSRRSVEFKVKSLPLPSVNRNTLQHSDKKIVDHERICEMSAKCFLEQNSSLGIVSETSGLEHRVWSYQRYS